MARNTKEKFDQRKRRVRAKIAAYQTRPRLSVFKSNKFIYGQLIDDAHGLTVFSVSSGKIKEDNVKTAMERAEKVGELVAKKALEKKIKQVVFDRSGYKYHGLVRALAEGARKGGLDF